MDIRFDGKSYTFELDAEDLRLVLLALLHALNSRVLRDDDATQIALLREVMIDAALECPNFRIPDSEDRKLESTEDIE